MAFADDLKTGKVILENGPMGTRLKELGINAAAGDFILYEKNREELKKFYRQDIAAAHKKGISIVINAATFRASSNHMRDAKLDSADDVRRVNKACIDLVKELRAEVSSGPSIYIGAPIGSLGDAYDARQTATLEDAMKYHRLQLQVFKDESVDFVNPVTLPRLIEAQAIALAAAELALDYTIGFTLDAAGDLLDGHKLHEAIKAVDDLLDTKGLKKPLGYMVTCTHSSVISKLSEQAEFARIIGIQANGTALSKEELATLDHSVADDPKEFAASIKSLETVGPFAGRMKMVAGCCGTDTRHVSALATVFADVGAGMQRAAAGAGAAM